MPRGKSLNVTAEAAIGLFFIQRYRFLTIDQYARIAGLNRITASHQLRFFELGGMLGHFGNTALAGHGKTPKVYYLTRKGFELLIAESDIPADRRLGEVWPCAWSSPFIAWRVRAPGPVHPRFLVRPRLLTRLYPSLHTVPTLSFHQ